MDKEGRKEMVVEFAEDRVNFLVEEGSAVSMDERQIRKLIGGLRGWLNWKEAGCPEPEEVNAPPPAIARVEGELMRPVSDKMVEWLDKIPSDDKPN